MFGVILGLLLGAAGWQLIGQWLFDRMREPQAPVIGSADEAHTTAQPFKLHRFIRIAGLPGSCRYCGESVETAGPICTADDGDLTYLGWYDKSDDEGEGNGAS